VNVSFLTRIAAMCVLARYERELRLDADGAKG
jgi:hypothetical protein